MKLELKHACRRYWRSPLEDTCNH